jgi:hypothetical protein
MHQGRPIDIRPECQGWYVLPYLLGSDIAVEGRPMTTACLDTLARAVFARIPGSDVRGFSSHRHGGATNASCLNVVDSGGVGFDVGRLRTIVRSGGWTDKNGEFTVMSTYSSAARDLFTDTSCLLLGRVQGEAEILARRREALGDDLCPTGVVRCARSRPHPLLVKMRAQLHAPFATARARLARLAGMILSVAASDPEILAIHRWCGDGEAFNRACSRHPLHPAVLEWNAVSASLSLAWAGALRDEATSCGAAFEVFHCALRPAEPLPFPSDLHGFDCCVEAVLAPDDAFAAARHAACVATVDWRVPYRFVPRA